MHPIGDDTPNATAEKEFTEGNVATGDLATPLRATWLNSLQRELLAILAAAAINPSGEDDDQVLEALQFLFAAKAHNHDTVYSKLDHLHDARYAASLLVQAGQLLLKAKDGGTMSTVDLSPLPPGTVIAHAAAAPPAGFLACNGAAVSRANYPALFAAIGVTWGVGDGATTFNLPNLVDDFIRGAGGSRNVGTRESDEVKSHTHQAAVFQGGNGDTWAETYGAGPDAVGYQYAGGGGYSGHTVMTGATGGSETRPRNVALLYVIKF